MTPKNILIVMAHADDEILGMGATLMKHIEQGDNVFMYSLTNANGGSLKLQSLYNEKLPQWYISGLESNDQSMDASDLNYFTNNITGVLDGLVNVGHPIDIVYTHSEGDINKDHRYVGEATRIACRPFSNATSYKVKEIRTFIIQSDFVASGKQFIPNLFIPVTQKHIDKAGEVAHEYGVDLDFKQIYATRCITTGRLIRTPLADQFDVIMRIAE